MATATVRRPLGVMLHVPVSLPGVDDLDEVARRWLAVAPTNRVAYIDRAAGQVVAAHEHHLNVRNEGATMALLEAETRRLYPDATLERDDLALCVRVGYPNGERR